MMKLIVPALIFILSVTLITYSDSGRFLFAGGSDSNHTLLAPNGYLMLLVVGVIVICVTAVSRSRSRAATVVCLALSLVLWVACGRTVAVVSDGRIVAGWFFLHTTTIDLREDDEDPEAYAARTRVTVSRPWCLDLHTATRSARLFVGPELIRPLVTVLRSRGFTIVEERR
ncbi:hypothetical protein [Sorangium sp. So ce1153]|uniref:hypothetical protein n=1 Tax=Sorangium sp. So ce1153 TaxID=3133333 RepID=UPI003F61188D